MAQPTQPQPKPTVLHIGDPVKYNPATYALLASRFTIIRPSAADRERPAFLRALRERKWGDFAAIFRPFWGSGGEMGKWDAELIGLLPDSVEVFASAGAGFDWADTEALGKKGIIYCNGGLAAAESVADFALAMVISTFRHLPWAMNAAVLPSILASGPSPALREQAFRHSHTHTTAHSHNPRSHTLAIIGLGKIGSLLAAKLGNPSMGMRIAYHDVTRKSPALEKKLGATFYADLRALMGVADCVVVCTPALPGSSTTTPTTTPTTTTGMEMAAARPSPLICAKSLSWLKPGARFVNIARGSLVDEEALADALESGLVSAAALDVHADEPRVNPRLVRMAGLQVIEQVEGQGHGREQGQGNGKRKGVQNPGRVMLTCHNAGGTVETHMGFEELAMRNILAVLGGEEAITPVNMQYLKRSVKSRL
ncbi:hypothetical protein BD289DRAFT_433340 [Coniella lustricola]|uniref:D-isomer specific 2-hydroxyacid dehydrogenase n=1 Tax=Coniella lustricola TaxID=2025994 RepID=A0A2T3A8K4_9PEZI|nr:hypothetical protein BD289DRAFT_433340 [Coniella lustricola]